MHKAFITVGLGFGDEGKGATVDALVRKHNAGHVIRYSGGAQCAHTVVAPDGRTHTFSQFGSGTFVEGVKTVLTEDVIFDPISLHWEEKRLQTVGIMDAYSRLYVHPDALVITPYNQVLNRVKEYCLGKKRRGSCGYGIGETVQYALTFPERALRVKDLLKPKDLENKLRSNFAEQYGALLYYVQLLRLKERSEQIEKDMRRFYDPQEFDDTVEQFHRIAQKFTILPEDYLFEALLEEGGTTVLEGAQGVLLDEKYGFPPHYTWSNTTTGNAIKTLHKAGFVDYGDEDGHNKIHRIGVMRAYQTRHGAGPLPTEDAKLTKHIVETHNPDNPWQGPFWCGWLDLNLLRYALSVCPVDSLAINGLDQLPDTRKVCIEYTRNGDRCQVQKLTAEKDHPYPNMTGHDYQETTGWMLNTAVPTYRDEAAGSNIVYALRIAEEVGVKLSIAGFGPSYENRLFF